MYLYDTDPSSNKRPHLFTRGGKDWIKHVTDSVNKWPFNLFIIPGPTC